ncbi:DgyrCDS5708 [Dimorphilus gyrociliatus]|uniref:DgyrCDS5708 n=1 Tax=Dimorphilus gyrociliatus TaxID=2664684 RepID=A0A7I8VMC3_9ANNE|nr:DgyrCDS5708 [Dimorphilus gyrociliatus]
MRSLDAQRNGLIFIYDMTSAKFPNFDYDLSVKILMILKGSFPARLKKILIVKAPLWFRAPFKFLRLFVREKLRDRVHTVDIKDLNQHVPVNALPTRLGGEHTIDHMQWLMDCFRIHSPEADALLINEKLEKFGVRTPSVSSVSSLTEKQSNEELEKDELFEEDSIHTANKEGMSPRELLDHVNKLKEAGLHEQYSQIRMERMEGTFEISKQAANISKNRYTDVHCLDSTRVKLKTCSYDDDYINANFVDGYLKSAMYISTQGPLNQTFGHFWRMIWEQGSHVIVMTTKVVERGRMKCGQYWPLSGSVVHDQFEIQNEDAEREKDFSITKLRLKYLPSQEERLITHFQFTSWPDYGTPPAGAFLNFMYQVRAAQGDSRKPIVVHCSAGIGRTGTFICMDIGTSKLDHTGYVDVRETVRRIRTQRAHSIQMPDQYVFCHTALLYYAQTKGLLKELRLELFDGRSDSD